VLEYQNSQTLMMKYGFKLSRPDQSDHNLVNYVIFTAESYEECLAWQEALSSYVI
jgi:hypothetical protein